MVTSTSVSGYHSAGHGSSARASVRGQKTYADLAPISTSSLPFPVIGAPVFDIWERRCGVVEEIHRGHMVVGFRTPFGMKQKTSLPLEFVSEINAKRVALNISKKALRK